MAQVAPRTPPPEAVYLAWIVTADRLLVPPQLPSPRPGVAAHLFFVCAASVST